MDKPRVFRSVASHESHWISSDLGIPEEGRGRVGLLITRGDEGAVVAVDVVERLREIVRLEHDDGIWEAGALWILGEALHRGLLPDAPAPEPKTKAKAQPEWPKTVVTPVSPAAFWHYISADDDGIFSEPDYDDIKASIGAGYREQWKRPHLDGVPLPEIKRRAANGTLLDTSLRWDFVTPEPEAPEAKPAVTADERLDRVVPKVADLIVAVGELNAKTREIEVRIESLEFRA